MVGKIDCDCLRPRRPERSPVRALPCIRGTRITVSAILGQLAAGRTVDEVLVDYPQLEREDVLAALEYAAADTNERVIALHPSG